MKAPQPTSRDRIPAILVITTPTSRQAEEEDRTAEMVSLLDTAGRSVVGKVLQHCERPIGATYIGTGKIAELGKLVKERGADEVYFDCGLSPRQQGNIEERAGGGPGGSGFLTGTGEKQIEMDRRDVRQRIKTLKERLETIAGRRDRVVAGRAECFNIALIGYTNAGKSTLMNALTGAGVLAEDRLFATLDTRTARLPLERHHHAVLSDTVGFIRDLPPKLIASFHATLAEVREADLLLHVVDSSSPAMEQQISAVEGVLTQIGADEVPAIVVFNKADRCFSRTLVGSFRKRYRTALSASALTGQGIQELKEAISQVLDRRQSRLTVRLSAADGALGAFVRSRARIESERYEGDEAILTLVADEGLQAELRLHPKLVVANA